MGDEDSADEKEGRRFEALREAVESESYLEEDGVAPAEEGESENDDTASSEPSEPATGAATSSENHAEDGIEPAAESPASPGDSPGETAEPARESPVEPSPDDSDPADTSTDGPADADSRGVSPAPDQPEWPSAEESGPSGDELAESLLSVSSILVLGSGKETDSGRVCSHLLGGGDGDQNVVVVTFADAPADRLAKLDASVAESNEVVVIDIGDMANDARASALDTDRWPTVSIRPMTNPSDASRLGMVIDDVVSAWDDEPYQTRVCFHSLSGLLEYMSDETAFRFIHTLLRRFAAVEAVAHFHMDTEAQSIETLRTLQVLFEEVVSVSEDGELSAVEM